MFKMSNKIRCPTVKNVSKFATNEYNGVSELVAYNVCIVTPHNKQLIMSTLKNIFYDNVGGRVWDTHGKEYPIKEHSNWKFINIGKDKVGVNTLENKIEIRSFDDFQFIYIFKGLSQTHPCIAMDYLIFRRIRKLKLSPNEYKVFIKNK